MSQCDVFIGHLFLARDVTHSTHLNTRNYAKHKALQKFYEGVIELADAFAEAYQGRYGLIGPIAVQRDLRESGCHRPGSISFRLRGGFQ